MAPHQQQWHKSAKPEQAVSPAQVAPEATNHGLYTRACDVWSLGILFYRMLFAVEPFSSFEEAADATKVPLPADARERVSEDALTLVRAMLAVDHTKRISVKEVRKRARARRVAGGAHVDVVCKRM
jgi:serine/threonine protein kinase